MVLYYLTRLSLITAFHMMSCVTVIKAADVATCSLFSKNKRHLVPSDFRNLMSLSYLVQNLSLDGGKASLHDVPLHRVLLKDITIRIFGADIPRTHILCAINASTVALCNIADDLVSIEL